MQLLTDSSSLYLLPLFIFFARILDVSLGTLRIIFMARGRKYLAPFLSFIEILIWATAIGQMVQNLENPICLVAFAGGFATGSFVGMLIEEKLAYGHVVLRTITPEDDTGLVSHLKKRQFGVTKVDAEGSQGKVHLIHSVIPRKDLPEAIEIIKQHTPEAFYSVEDVRMVSEGIFPPRPSSLRERLLDPLLSLRKGK